MRSPGSRDGAGAFLLSSNSTTKKEMKNPGAWRRKAPGSLFAGEGGLLLRRLEEGVLKFAFVQTD